jgi:4-diphosphocytidyl-2-C-methyl-D-erythritol kinase
MLSLKAPAKINWILWVGSKRDDGYHEIQSLIQKVSLYDELSFALSEGVTLDTETPVSTDENLVYRAAIMLKETYGVEAGASITLKKNIPIGAGLGGGSSDAAAALIGLNKLWSLGLTKEQLSTSGAKLGSDVPFFLFDNLSYVHGRGEKVSARCAERPVDILLVNPLVNISTAWVYERFAARRASVEKGNSHRESLRPRLNRIELTKKAEKVNNIEHFIRNIERAELLEIADSVSNDLESVTIKSFPVVAEIKEELVRQGAVVSLMSGSGPTVFAVFESQEKAREASRHFNDCWTSVVKTII